MTYLKSGMYSMHTLDAKNLLCPMPVIRTQDAVNKLQPGEQLQVTCTDPGALNDVPAWCRINGHKVLQTEQNDNEILIIIEVGNES